MIRTPYRFPEQLLFKHLEQNELFVFPAGQFTPVSGPYKKISPRRYVRVSVRIVGERILSDVAGGPILIGTINAAVSDRVTDHLVPSQSR